MGKEQPFAILKMDRPRGNIVVSRRAILEEARAEQRTELVSQLQEGEVREGVVKNITDYGAFVDLGGIDGLLHVTDMSWKRVNHPSQVLAVGDTVKVQIIKINPDTQRISLGMKQLQSDPWDGVDEQVRRGHPPHRAASPTSPTTAPSWSWKPGSRAWSTSRDELDQEERPPGQDRLHLAGGRVIVLDVDGAKRRISLGLKQAQPNPWETFSERHPVGSTVEGEVKNTTEFGLFIGLEDDIDGMVHLSDIDWNTPGEEAMARYKKGEMVKAVVLDIDPEKERIGLGIKQLGGDPMTGDGFRKGQTVTTTVTEVTSGGLEVKFGEEEQPMTAFIRKADLSRDRADQRPERFAVGDRIDAQITNIDKAKRTVSLSVKALELRDEKEAIEQFGSSDSGASLGDILGAALRGAQTKE
jgi:small subunit ribosomal protein S1